MAQITATAAESLRSWGGAPSDTWGMTWGAFLWGYGTNKLPIGLNVGIAVTQASVEAIQDTLVISIGDSLTISGALLHVYKRERNGYYYVIPNNTTDGEAGEVITWAVGSNTAPTWASAAVTAITWS